MTSIYIDADACPVKEETYRVAGRYAVRVFVVSNSGMKTPLADWCQAVVLPTGFSTVDDWIAERAGPGDIVITSDIPLAERCLKNGSRVLSPRGHAFTADMIGEALATRALMEELRQMGTSTGGPAPMGKQDRSRYLSRLDEAIHAARRDAPI
jgi:uncharacterized protein YaiI (UPF0178 family)